MNILAERSFPSFFKTKSAKLLKFYSDWLDWTERPGNVKYAIGSLASEQDIDESVAAYKTHLRTKLIADFPERTATDLKLLLKTVLWLYRAKSSRKAYDFLFRVLYNSPAKIWHPRETMLRTSDGHWDIPQYFCIVPEEAPEGEEGETPIQFAARHLGWMAEGQSTGARAFITGATAFNGEAEILTSEASRLCRVRLYETIDTKTGKAVSVAEAERARQEELAELESAEEGSLSEVAFRNGHWEFRKKPTKRLYRRLLLSKPNKSSDNDGITARLWCDPLMQSFKIALSKNPDEGSKPSEEPEAFSGASVDLDAEFSIDGIDRTICIPAGTIELVFGGADLKATAVQLSRETDGEPDEVLNEPNIVIHSLRNFEWHGVAFVLPELDDSGSFVEWNAVNADRLTIANRGDLALLDKGTAYPLAAEEDAVYLGTLDVAVSADANGTETVSRSVGHINIGSVPVRLWQNYGTERQSLFADPDEADSLWRARIEWNGTGLDAVLLHYQNDETYVETALFNPDSGTDEVVSVTAEFDTYIGFSAAEGIGGSKEDYRNGWEKGVAVINLGESRAAFKAAFIEDSSEPPALVDGWNASSGSYRKNLSDPDINAFLSYDFDVQKYRIDIKEKGINGEWNPKALSYGCIASLSIEGENWNVSIPEDEPAAWFIGRKAKHRIVEADIQCIYGIGIDSASMHFAPGERIRLSNPDNGEVSEEMPTVWWHAESEGHYTTTHGFVSDINAIQDNHYWQTYSYVVQSYVGIREWRRIVKRLLHPAGLIIFGEVLLEGSLEDGNGIMKMPDWEFLRRLDIFFRRMTAMSKQALLWHQNTISTCRLAQTHSITSDLWLYWIRLQEEAKDSVSTDLLRAMLYGGSFTDEERNELRSLLEAYAAQDWLPAAEKENLDFILNGIKLERVNTSAGIETIVLEQRPVLEKSRSELTEEDRRALEEAARLIEEKQSLAYGEDLRDWFDIRPSDVERHLNANSVLLFRNDGTLIDPAIVDWVDFSFTGDIDLPFEFKRIPVQPTEGEDGYAAEGGEPLVDTVMVNPHTTSIIGTTLHPRLPMIHGTVVGNCLAVSDEQEFIPKLHLAFVTSTKPSNGSLVRLLNKENNVLEFSDASDPLSFETAQVKLENADSLAKRLTYFNAGPAGIVKWRALTLNDFIAVPADELLIFNEYSLMKIPDAWVEEREADRAYVFSRNAWDNEKGVVVSYSPFDFSYRIWLERSNAGIVCTATAFNSSEAMDCPLVNANIDFESAASNLSVDDIAVVKIGYTEEERIIQAATMEWKMSFKDIGKQASWFDFKLPEIVDRDRILCFVNGLLSSSFKFDESTGIISVDTVKDNSNIVYDSKEWLLGELSLEEWVYELDENGKPVLIDKYGDPEDEANWKHVLKNPDLPDEKSNWQTKLVMVSVSESESIAFQNATLQTPLIFGEEMIPVLLQDITEQTSIMDVVGCTIRSSLTHAEIYILSPIEASRKLKYPWHGWKMQAKRTEYGITAFDPELDDASSAFDIWPFTYDNARLFPFAAHRMDLIRRSDAEIAPDKEAVKPIRELEVQWRKVRRLGTDFVRTFRTTSIAVPQRQSETVDRILETWWDGASVLVESLDSSNHRQTNLVYWNRAPKSLRGGPAFLELGFAAVRGSTSAGNAVEKLARLTVEDDIPAIGAASGSLDCTALDGTASVLLNDLFDDQIDESSCILDASQMSSSLQAMVDGFWTDVQIEPSMDGRSVSGTAKGRTAFEVNLNSDGTLTFARHLTLKVKGEDVFKGDFGRNAAWLASANRSSTLLFGEDDDAEASGNALHPKRKLKLVDPEDFNWSQCSGTGGKSVGFPKKWWSVPLLADKPVEEAVVDANGTIQSNAEFYKDGTSLVFVDGLKILDTDVVKNGTSYAVDSSLKDGKALVYSMGESWMMENEGSSGYFNAKKLANGSWAVSALESGRYVQKSTAASADWFDLVDFVGISMNRGFGVIWKDETADDISFAIRGNTEIYWRRGDKRRFVDLRFLDEVDVASPAETMRLYAVGNSRRFGAVERIVDIDPRFLMVFIDGRYSPWKSGEWRYIKGTFFVECEAEQSVEVYIGNPLSYLLPDSAYAAPEGIGELAFNNLRVNIVPRHHLEAVFKHEFRLGTFFRRRSEVKWFKTFNWGFIGYERERWVQSLAVVQRQSETFDDILYWKQMSPNAWLDESDPLKWSNKSSLLVFDANGNLIDPIRIDWHRKTFLPWTASLLNIIEYAQPYVESAQGTVEPGTYAYTGYMYFPGWEYDQTEGKTLHTALHVLDDGRTEGRYRDLVESNWTTVYIDGVSYDYDQWYRKLFVDLHLEESIFVNEWSETSPDEYRLLKSGMDCLPFEDDNAYRLTEGENLRLSDILLNSIQEGDSLNGRLWSFQIEAEREAVRFVVVGDSSTPMRVEVPTADGAMVFVDGKKISAGLYSVISSADGKTYISLDANVYGDSMEHSVVVYWPSAGYGTPVQSGSLCNALYANAAHPLWEKILQSACLDVYDKPALQERLEALLSESGMLEAFQHWIGEYRYGTDGTFSGNGANGNGIRLASALGLNFSGVGSITAHQAAQLIAERKPELLPAFIRSLHEALDGQKLVQMYVEWTKHIGFEAPLVEQFREYIESRYLLFVDGVHVPVTVDSSGRIVLEIQDRHVFAEDYEPDAFELYCIDIERYHSLRSSTARSLAEDQGLAFSNLRTFKLAESNTLAKLRRTFDWSIQYFIRSDVFKTHIDIFMNRLGFIRTSKEIWNSGAELVSETIDEVIARGQMDASAWAGLDFDIGAKASRSSVMLFDSEGGLIDPADVDYADRMLKPKSLGKTVEILNPKDDGVQMARVYWPIYAADQEGHSAPFECDSGVERRYANLRDTSFDTIYVDGGAYDIDQHFRKDAGNIHLEETVWAKNLCPDVWTNSRANAQIEPSRYASLLDEDEDWWSNEENIQIDAERLLLSDFVCTDVVNAGGSVAAVSIDADSAVVREVVAVLSSDSGDADTHFVVFVPKLKGALVFIDGKKQSEESYWKQAWENGIQIYNSDSVDYSNVPANADAYSIEFTQSELKDGNEHVVVVYYPSSSWAERTASGNLQDAVESSLYPTLVYRSEDCVYEYKPHWSQLQFKTFNEYVQSRLVLFCGGMLQTVTGNPDEEIFINGVPLASYSCSSDLGFELYAVDILNADCRVSTSQSSEFEQDFIIGNRQKNWFMEHHGQTRWIRELQEKLAVYTGEVVAVKSTITMPDPTLEHSLATVRSWTYTRNNRDTLDNVFCRGSLPVRPFMNPSLYVERITKLEIAGLNEEEWIILEAGDDIESESWVPVYAREIGLDGTPTGREDSVVLDLSAADEIVDGELVYTSMYIPDTWDIAMYATSRENPAWFLPCERIDPSRWRYYSGWNRRLVFLGLEPGKDVYIVETLDKSVEGSVANTDQVFWLEKEFNKKSTLVLDREGLLVHPDGLEWCDGKYVFPHSGTWTAQPEEAKFPAIVNEMIPDNVKWRLVMDLCLDDLVGYDQEIALVADACLDSEVAVNPRITFSKPWGAIANRDCIYWEEGEFRNWNAWLRDDDVFDRETCFVFVNGFKIPDGQWTWHSDVNMIEIPKKLQHMIARLQLAKRESILEEWIHLDEFRLNLIDEEVRDVREYQESDGGNVFVDVDWATWLDKDGFPVQGGKDEIPEDAYILVDHPDPREGIIWPVDRIRYRHYTAEVKALRGRIDTPDYLGHDLRLYVLCFVDGRLVQCGFDGTAFTVPGWQEAEVIEAYVFELHDAVWIDRFNADLPILNLRNLRDLKVC